MEHFPTSSPKPKNLNRIQNQNFMNSKYNNFYAERLEPETPTNSKIEGIKFIPTRPSVVLLKSPSFQHEGHGIPEGFKLFKNLAENEVKELRGEEDGDIVSIEARVEVWYDVIVRDNSKKSKGSVGKRVSKVSNPTTTNIDTLGDDEDGYISDRFKKSTCETVEGSLGESILQQSRGREVGL